MVDHLQGGFEGIQLERTAEHADFNGIRVCEINRRIAPGTGIFRVVHLLGRRQANAVPRRPAVHLALRAAAKAKQLRPEFLYKVQQPRNRGLLLFIGTAECQTGDMNVQSAGSCRVAGYPMLCALRNTSAHGISFK